VLRSGMVDFPAPRYVHYSYQYTFGPRALSIMDPDMAAVSKSMAILADNNPLFQDGRFIPNRLKHPLSRNHGGRGQNVLYLDMHAAWTTSANVGVNGNNIYLIDGVNRYNGTEIPQDKTDSFLLPAYTGR